MNYLLEPLVENTDCTVSG